MNLRYINAFSVMEVWLHWQAVPQKQEEVYAYKLQLQNFWRSLPRAAVNAPQTSHKNLERSCDGNPRDFMLKKSALTGSLGLNPCWSTFVNCTKQEKMKVAKIQKMEKGQNFWNSAFVFQKYLQHAGSL